MHDNVLYHAVLLRMIRVASITNYIVIKALPLYLRQRPSVSAAVIKLPPRTRRISRQHLLISSRDDL
jgi:hypothetical protein